MAKESVFFIVRGQNYPTVYNRAQLRRGALVYITYDAYGKAVRFSPQPSPDATVSSVVWISDEWEVQLYDKLTDRNLLVLPQMLDSVIGDILPRSVIDDVIGRLASRLRLTELYKTDELLESPLSVLDAVADRLDLYRRLAEPAVGKRLDLHQESLLVYLALTCFDRLGQPADWLDFGAWLQSKKHKNERVAIAVEAGQLTDSVDISLAMYTGYTRLYGVKSAFFRFLREVLPGEARTELLNSLFMLRLSYPPNMKAAKLMTDVDKEQYLFSLRNRYTHRGHSVYSPNSSYTDPIFSDPNVLRGYEQYHYTDDWLVVKVKQWPASILRAVRAGLVAYINAIP